MTNLPIIGNTPRTPGNAANATQTNSTSDNQAAKGSLHAPVKGTPPNTRFAGGPGTGGRALVGKANPAQASAGSGLSIFGVSPDAVEPFAALLARQIGEVDSSFTNVAPGAITNDGAAPSLKDEQGMAATDSTPGDHAGTLAAIMLQLPPEMHTPITNDAADTSTAKINATGIGASARKSISRVDATLDMASTALGKTDTTAIADGKQIISNATDIGVSARKSVSQTDAMLDMASTALGKTDTAAIAADKQIITDVIGQNSVKCAELAASLPQPSPNTTQLITSSAISAMMPNTLTNNRPADTTQTITTLLGNSGWADDFSQKINWMNTQKNQVAELHLNPPDLGPLNVVLKISDNQATALFTSPHSAVRDAVENAMPKLREILADNGIMLGNATVSDQFPRDRGAEGFMNQGSGTAAQRGVSSGASDSTGALPATAQTMPARRHNGMVDTFA